MPYLDRRTGELVIRVVYDGSPEAGKTTNVRALCNTISLQRRGEMVAPGTTGRRTEFFDWLDFAGGYVDGRRVRCQLVTVPGQTSLLRRRKYLLDTADAVVFVADSRPLFAGSNQATFQQLSRSLARRSSTAPVKSVVQANKQDLASALSPHELRVGMRLSDEVPCVPAVASDGKGVTETFLIAVRLAFDRVRVLLAEEQLGEDSDGPGSHEALFEALIELDASTVPSEPSSKAPSQRPSAPRVNAPSQRPSAPRANAPSQRPSGAPRAKAPSPPPPRPSPPPSGQVRLPRAELIPAGGCWPGATARATWASLERVPCSETAPRAWAPPDAIELRYEGGYRVHTTLSWAEAEQASATGRLRRLVRQSLAAEPWLPEGRILGIGQDGACFRLFMITPPTRSLADQFDAGFWDGDGEALQAALEAWLEVMIKLRASPPAAGAPMRWGLDTASLEAGRVVCLSLPHEHEQDVSPAQILRDARRRFRAAQALPELATRFAWAMARVRRSYSATSAQARLLSLMAEEPA